MDFVSLQLNKDVNVPLYMQLSSNIAELIKKGNIEPEEKLPPIRKLAKDLNVNNVTVVNAYKHLESNGYIKAIQGSGYYVLGKESDRIKNNVVTTPIDEEFYDNDDIKLMTSGQIELTENTINFASATPDPSIFPIESFKAALNEVLDRDKGFAFGYQESNGYEPLRETLCDFLYKYNGIKAQSNHIQIVSGAQQGIDIIGKALLNPGDFVITENPTYTGAVAVFKSRGAKVIGVPINEDGIDLSILERQIKAYSPKLIYVMTNYQTPTTITYSKEKLIGLLKLAEKYNIYIVEDDSLSGLSFDANEKNYSLKAIDTEDRVIYIKSFSKLLMPGLRIGFILSPEGLSSELLKAKHTTDISSSGLIQRALDMYFKKGQWEKHMDYMREIYSNKYNAMIYELEKLSEYGVTYSKPNGGLNFWVTLPHGIEATNLYLECAKKDVLIVPCKVFFVNNYRNNDNTIRLSFAATNAQQIKEGMSIIKDSIVKLSSNVQNRKYFSPMI